MKDKEDCEKCANFDKKVWGCRLFGYNMYKCGENNDFYSRKGA